LLKCNTLIRK
jgi:tetratricopeptide repeat protein 8